MGETTGTAAAAAISKLNSLETICQKKNSTRRKGHSTQQQRTQRGGVEGTGMS